MARFLTRLSLAIIAVATLYPLAGAKAVSSGELLAATPSPTLHEAQIGLSQGPVLDRGELLPRRGSVQSRVRADRSSDPSTRPLPLAGGLSLAVLAIAVLWSAHRRGGNTRRWEGVGPRGPPPPLALNAA